MVFIFFLMLFISDMCKVVKRKPTVFSFNSYLLFLLQLWIEERMPLAISQEHGHNLQTVQMLLKKNQVKDLSEICL